MSEKRQTSIPTYPNSSPGRPRRRHRTAFAAIAVAALITACSTYPADYDTLLEEYETYVALSAAVFIVLIIALAALGVLLWQKMRRHSEAIEELKRAIREKEADKEAFVSRFMDSVCTYKEILSTRKMSLIRQLATSPASRVLEDLKNGRYDAEVNQVLLQGFDRAFLDVYPDFVSRLNTLLADDKQYAAESASESLPMELRVMALTRLGIDDGQRIAQYLGVSVNTVYAYRNRVRSRSTLPREEFDAAFRTI